MLYPYLQDEEEDEFGNVRNEIEVLGCALFFVIVTLLALSNAG